MASSIMLRLLTALLFLIIEQACAIPVSPKSQISQQLSAEMAEASQESMGTNAFNPDACSISCVFSQSSFNCTACFPCFGGAKKGCVDGIEGFDLETWYAIWLCLFLILYFITRFG